MSIKRNFTGHTRLEDNQFKQYYKQLFDACPRPISYTEDSYWDKVRASQRKFFKEQEKTISKLELPGEVWREHPTYKKFEVSNLGRIRKDGVILRQIDDPHGRLGYLVLEKYPSILVYRFVSDCFLDRLKPYVKGLEVHHINNDGYNCREDNLILLTRKQHNAIHKNEMEDF